MPEVAMPRLSDSMEEGTILKWLRSDGDAVAAGDELVEIETDKANMTYEAEAAGTLAIVAREGETLPVGAVIARLGDAPVEPSAAPRPGSAAAAPEPAAAPEAAAALEPEPAAAAPEPVAAAPAASDADDGAPAPNGGGPKASPVARRMARELGVALDDIPGSGPGGRITKRDVAVAAGAPAPAAPAPAAPPAPSPSDPPPAAAADGARSGTVKGDVTVQELTRLQQTVARRMAESKATAPEFVLHVDVDMEAAAELRDQLKGLDGATPSFNDFVIKAAALALRQCPRANGAYRDGRFELYSRVNVGMAVAASDALVVPTVFDADTKPLRRIAAETRALAERVRSGEVTPPELSGGTFTVSNLGMYGMHRIVPVINPPQAAILGVGAIEPRAVPRDGELTVRRMMGLTLVCDHRILYGAEAAEFLGGIREALEQPLRLALA